MAYTTTYSTRAPTSAEKHSGKETDKLISFRAVKNVEIYGEKQS